MTTKTDPTNEEVVGVLGWKFDMFGNEWAWINPDKQVFNPIPDVTHDMNESVKHVWPVLRDIVTATETRDVLAEIACDALYSPNPAMYFAIKLIELKNAS